MLAALQLCFAVMARTGCSPPIEFAINDKVAISNSLQIFLLFLTWSHCCIVTQAVLQGVGKGVPHTFLNGKSQEGQPIHFTCIESAH